MAKIKLNDKQKHQALHQIFTEWKLYPPVAEHQFHPERKWKFDFAWPLSRIALEVEGGIYGHTKKDGTKSKVGAHSSIGGILRDMEKYNAATMMGWKVIRCTPTDLFKETTLRMIKQLLTNPK